MLALGTSYIETELIARPVEGHTSRVIILQSSRGAIMLWINRRLEPVVASRI